MYPRQHVAIWTLGHGNRPVDQFVQLLADNQIKTLVDIRSHPHSVGNPQYDEPHLCQILSESGCVYHWAGKAFGGLRRAQVNSRHQALVASAMAQGFADHMDTRYFQKSAMQLINLARRGSVALMCAEFDYRKCHRRLLSDYLALAGVDVLHINAGQDIVPHCLSPEARRESAEVIYDRNITATLNFQ